MRFIIFRFGEKLVGQIRKIEWAVSAGGYSLFYFQDVGTMFMH